MKHHIEAYRRLERDKQIIEDAQREIREKLAKECPVQPGNKIRVPDFTYTYEKKPCVVDRVDVFLGHSNSLQWRVMATLLKKDGTAGKIKTSWISKIPDSVIR